MAVRALSSIAKIVKALLKQTDGLGTHLVSYVLIPIFWGLFFAFRRGGLYSQNAWEAASDYHHRITHLPFWQGQQELAWFSNWGTDTLRVSEVFLRLFLAVSSSSPSPENICFASI